MDIILQQNVDELGLEGDVVKVARGYARNFLIPKGIGVEASEANLKALELKRKKINLRRLKAREQAENLRKEMEEVVVRLSQKAGEEGKLYGSVTTMDIASHLEKQNIMIDRRKILLEKPIKMVGEFDVPIKIYPEVIGSIKVIVTPLEKEGEDNE
ncbi:MAG: 50S ribosomal protein L9 [Desulfatiglans sp.]|jgi:large subunit ribosomal protein L9|nr:50S ribosomal protein L9 [Thermodesulfobacteriota bacterium]MEE4354168.1 50S ribosomal protein L9 [Desulfatiglans sp.]